MTVLELKAELSRAMGGSIRPDSVTIFEANTVLEEEITFTDLEYGPGSPPLIAEENDEPKRLIYENLGKRGSTLWGVARSEGFRFSRTATD
jgi:hypothetical protein